MNGKRTPGWYTVRAEFAAAIAVPAFVAFLVLASPNYMYEQPSLLDSWVAWVGIGIYLLGFAWMVRIYRADPEAHMSFWRSRRF